MEKESSFRFDTLPLIF